MSFDARLQSLTQPTRIFEHFFVLHKDYKTEGGLTSSSFLAFPSRAVPAPLRTAFALMAMAFSIQSRSLSLSSFWMISMSRKGSTSPST